MPQPNTTVIAEFVAKLLNHFGTVDEPVPVRKAIARDWVEDLSEFTPGQVIWATTEWRRNQTMRPTIADIRRLATQAQHNENERLAALEDQREVERGKLPSEIRKLWDNAEYHGDIRSPEQRRNDAIARQNEKYDRAQAWREGKLDAYDADHHPERLVERKRVAARAAPAEPAYSTPDRSIGNVLREMGITAEPAGKAAE